MDTTGMTAIIRVDIRAMGIAVNLNATVTLHIVITK